MFRLVKNNIQGYTLIELLIALALLGIVVAPILNLFATGYSLINDSRMHTTALNLCRARLEEMRALGYIRINELYLADPSSPVVEANPSNYYGFTRETTFTIIELPCTTNAEQPVVLLQIDVTVSWQDYNHEKKETLATYLGKR